MGSIDCCVRLRFCHILILLTEPVSVEASFVLQIDRKPVCVDHSTLLQIPYTFFVLWR
jgi:hypothetical protein